MQDSEVMLCTKRRNAPCTDGRTKDPESICPSSSKMGVSLHEKHTHTKKKNNSLNAHLSPTCKELVNSVLYNLNFVLYILIIYFQHIGH